LAFFVNLFSFLCGKITPALKSNMFAVAVFVGQCKQVRLQQPVLPQYDSSYQLPLHRRLILQMVVASMTNKIITSLSASCFASE
jgi:hypothetical protein